MKNILSLILLITITAFASSCKQDKKEANESVSVEAKKPETTKITTDNSLLNIVKNMAKVKAAQVPDMKREAKVIIDHRYKQTDKKAYIILDKDLWEYEFVFTGKTMTKPGQLAGMWIDFNEDQTYSYGYYDQNYGEGIYTFDLDSGLLLLIDNGDEIKPQEFEAKLFDRSLIMDGNEIYRDNNYNAKLRRIDAKPVKIG
ncbi:MAG: hypothetical protein ACJA1A_002853 [Saprospiraceae bacterium]|mgnify:CR=1 FL=1|jgi:hypothetical protein|tara:strand:+ start:364 stop:963 length:600 start_codon:yes stop_codon:yes gene_type:complete